MADKSKNDERELLRSVLSSPAVGVPHTADEQARKTFADRRRDQAEAYGQFVAKGPIYWPGTGTLVFNTGAAVPIEHVEKWDLELADVVERVATPELARAGRRHADRAEEMASAMSEGEPSSQDSDDGNTGGQPRKSTTAVKSSK